MDGWKSAVVSTSTTFKWDAFSFAPNTLWTSIVNATLRKHNTAQSVEFENKELSSSVFWPTIIFDFIRYL